MLDLKNIYNDVVNDIKNMSDQDFKNEMEQKVMPDLDLYQIKQLYCKFKCNLKHEKVNVSLENTEPCPKCNKKVTTYYEGEAEIGEESACEICQWDNIIRELKEFNIIQK